MFRTMALLCCLSSLSALPLRADPMLRPGPGQPAPQELITQIIQANSPWLHQCPQSLSYKFAMTSLSVAEPWKASVTFHAPNALTVEPEKGQRYEGKADDGHHSAERLRTVLQGITFFGPLHEFVATPPDHAVKLVGEEKLGDKDADIIQITPTRAPSAEELARWEKRFSHPKFMYDFLPVRKTVDGVEKIVMEIRCQGEEGPGWPAIKAAHEANPSQISWGGANMTAELRDYNGEKKPVVVLDVDPVLAGQSPIRLTQFNGGIDNMTPKLTLGEGESVFDDHSKELAARTPKPWSYLPMTVGCGIWGAWFGYSGGGAQVDQVWFDRVSHTPLREEGLRDEGTNSFVVEYGDYEQIPGGHLMPRHVLVTLYGKGDFYPWVFDMTFDTHGGAAWLLKEISEYSGKHTLMATAKTTDVMAEAGAAEK